MNRFNRWWKSARPRWWQGPAPTETPPASNPDRKPLKIKLDILERIAALRPAKPDTSVSYTAVWEKRQYPPGVLPDGKVTLAMDDASGGVNIPQINAWAGSQSAGLWAEGIGFMGYPYLAELTQRPEYRRPSELIAEECTRKWIRLKSTGDVDKSEKIRELDDRIRHFKLREKFHDAVLYDGFFGLSFLSIDLGNADDREEQQTPLTITPQKIAKGSLKGFVLIDPSWTAPNLYNSTNPLRPDFYKPRTWFVMGTQVHATRLLITTSRPVPDLLKPAYNFGGISLSQMLKPYVDNWLTTRQGVNDIVLAFTQFVLETNLMGLLGAGGGDDEMRRVQLFTQIKTNLGVLLTDKETESFQNVSAPLGGLDKLQAQSQEHMASVYGAPLLKAFGLSPSGLNTTSDNEIRSWYDVIAAYQERAMGGNLKRALEIIQLDLWGAIDPEIEYEWVPLWQLDAAGLAAVQKIEADTAAVQIESGVLAPEEERDRIANDPASAWHGLKGPAPEPPEEARQPDLNDPSESIAKHGAEGSENGANAADAAFSEVDHPRDVDGKFDYVGHVVEAMKRDQSAKYGLRTTEDPIEGPLEPSRVWKNGKPTERRLSGVSTTRIRGGTHAQVERAFKVHSLDPTQYYYGQHLHLIKGTSAKAGYDPEEVLLSNAEIVHHYTKEDSGHGAPTSLVK